MCTVWYMYHTVQRIGRVRMERSHHSRDRLLAAALEHVGTHGISDLSLRGLASALGTSHRMLIYHFGSREGLLVEIVRTVEERQRAALVELGNHPGATPAQTARRMWREMADPRLWPAERLFFEVYSQALQGNRHAQPLLDGIVDAWIEPLVELFVRSGATPSVARAEARLGVAVTRGLLLDLLATGDREGVDQAMERFVASYEQRAPAVPHRTTSASPAAHTDGRYGAEPTPSRRRSSRPIE